MFNCGIDIAKNKHWARVVNSNGQTIVEPFEFENNHKGFKFLLDQVKHLDLTNILFSMESTGHYDRTLSKFLLKNNCKIGSINPLQTNALRKVEIRKTKNDKIDTGIIAKCALLGNFSTVNESDPLLEELKSLTRFREQLVKDRTRAKLRLVSCLDQSFPELDSFFKGNLHLDTSYALLEKYSLPTDLKNVRIDTLITLLSTNSKGRYSKEEASKLKDLAKDSIGINNPSLSIQIKLLIKQIKLLNEQIEEIESKTKSIMDELDSVILSIPGISYTLGSIILSEITDINNFSESCKLLAFAGLDPSVIQSGNFNAPSTKISKRGSSSLRYALVKAASLIIRYNDTFNKYYTEKRNQGKDYYCALGHVAHKLVRVIFHLLKNNEVFNLE